MNGPNHQIASNQTMNPGLIPCVWMQAGVVDYKLCDRDYDCEHCPFDEALHTRSSQQALRERRAQSESTIVQGCGVEPETKRDVGEVEPLNRVERGVDGTQIERLKLGRRVEYRDRAAVAAVRGEPPGL